MSVIAIKDLNENTTLDQAAMSDCYGGKSHNCPKRTPGGYLPNGVDRRGEHKSLDLGLGHKEAGITSEIDNLLNIGPLCGPIDEVRG